MHSRRAKDTGAALALYDEMRRDGVLPDVVAYNICLTAAGGWRGVAARGLQGATGQGEDRRGACERGCAGTCTCSPQQPAPPPSARRRRCRASPQAWATTGAACCRCWATWRRRGWAGTPSPAARCSAPARRAGSGSRRWSGLGRRAPRRVSRARVRGGCGASSAAGSHQVCCAMRAWVACRQVAALTFKRPAAPRCHTHTSWPAPCPPVSACRPPAQRGPLHHPHELPAEGGAGAARCGGWPAAPRAHSLPWPWGGPSSAWAPHASCCLPTCASLPLRACLPTVGAFDGCVPPDGGGRYRARRHGT